jgi:hypothetical protein
MDFIAKPAAVVTPLRAHFTWFHGVLVANASRRAQLTPKGRRKWPVDEAAPAEMNANDELRSPERRRRSMTWTQGLEHILNTVVATCVYCDGAMWIVVSIEELTALRAIPAHFEEHAG